MTFPSRLVIQLYRIATAADQLGNTLIGGRPRETISGTLGRALARKAWWAPPIAAAIDWIFGKNHCAKQAVVEAQRRTNDERPA